MKKFRSMLRVIFLRLIYFLVVFSESSAIAELQKLEYFLDEDPGFGMGSPILLSGNDSQAQIPIDTSSLNPGVHTLYVRSQDGEGTWGIIQSRAFFVDEVVVDPSPIVQLEWFIDQEPGFDNGDSPDPETFISGEDVTVPIDVNMENLAPGIHTLYVRAKDENGNWSILQQRSLFKPKIIPPPPDITQIEYFIDQDPGLGNGASPDNMTTGKDVTGSFDIDLDNLAPGVHTLYTRVKDENNNWSILQQRCFFKPETILPLPDIVQLEYFIDQDPGIGNGTSPDNMAPGKDVTGSFDIDLDNLAPGVHTLYTRVKDENDNWSILQQRSFLILKEIPPTPEIVRIEYFIDQDPGFGLGQAISFLGNQTETQTNFVVDLHELPPGLHTLYVRVEDKLGDWSIVQNHSFFVPSVPEPTADIVDLEYFVDQDPGFGQASPIPLAPLGDAFELVKPFSVELKSLSIGEHKLYVRAKDSKGNWSIIQQQEFERTSPPVTEVVIEDVTVTELLGKPIRADFEVRLVEQENRQDPVLLTFSTSGGSAISGRDYVAVVDEPFTIEPGVSTHIVSVDVNNDFVRESSEFFFVELSTTSNVNIARPKARGTIRDVSERIRDVTELADEVSGSLRDTIAIADNGDIISIGLEGTVTLTAGEIMVDKPLSIIAGNDSRFVIDGNSASRIFSITADDVLIVNFSIINGSAEQGGAIFNQGKNLMLSRMTLANHSASQDGGAVYNEGEMVFVNSTLAGNSASQNGGAIYNSESGKVDLFSSTIAQTSATETSGAIHNLGAVSLTHTLLAHGESGKNCMDSSGITSGGYNLDSDGSCMLGGTGDLAVDPHIDNLADNGGATETHNLPQDSPAVNAGNPDGCPGPDETVLDIDQRGFPRVDVSVEGGGLICDIGSVEVGLADPPIVEAQLPDVDDGITVNSAIMLSLNPEVTGPNVVKVEYFYGDTFIGEGVGDSHEVQWTPPEVGIFIIVVIVTDENGVKSAGDSLTVEVDELDIAFVTPRIDEAPVSDEDAFLFLWNMPKMDPPIEFDLYLVSEIPQSNEELDDVDKLNNAKLNSDTNREGYNHLDGFKGFIENDDDTITRKILFPVIQVTSESNAGQFFVALSPLTVVRNRLQRQARAVFSRPWNGQTFRFGETINVRAFLIDEFQNYVTDKGITIDLLVKSASHSEELNDRVIPINNVDGSLKAELSDLPVGDWSLNMSGGNGNGWNIEDDKIQIRILSGRTQLKISDLEKIRFHSTERDLIVKGQLNLLDDIDSNLDLSELEILLRLNRLDEANSTQNSISGREVTEPGITRSDGSFEIVIEKDNFNKVRDEGEWGIQAVFQGTADLKASVSESFVIPIRKKPGYAILVLGQTEETNKNPEGLEVHWNTLTSVEKNLVKARFDTGTDIQWVRWDADHPTETEELLSEAIGSWAKDRMLESPAPLYIVLVNHGVPGGFDLYNAESDVGAQSRFCVQDGMATGGEANILRPCELDGMIRDLELGIADDPVASNEPIVVVLGMCYSGSFVPELSAPGRVIISAATEDERSIREPFSNTVSPQQGEYFVYQLFNEFARGSSLLLSFQRSQGLISAITENLLFKPLNEPGPLSGRPGQHPLLDDNGDGVGRTIVSGIEGDGRLARRIFLSNPENAPLLEIKGKNPSRFLTADADVLALDFQPDPFIWTTISDDATVRMAVRFSQLKEQSEDINSIQLDLNLANEIMDDDSQFTDGIRRIWPGPDMQDNDENLFDEPGRHEVYFFIEDSAALPGTTNVYRASGSSRPTEFVLEEPVEGAQVGLVSENEQSLGIFTWEVSSSDSGEVRYLLRIWEEKEKNTLAFESPLLQDPIFFLTSEVLSELDSARDYWWDVVAVDNQGNATFSCNPDDESVCDSKAPRKFTPFIGNFNIFLFKGRALDAGTGNGILSRHLNVTIAGVEEEQVVTKILNDGKFRIFFHEATSKVEISVIAEGYDQSRLTLTELRQKENDQDHDFYLNPAENSFYLEIQSEYGNPIGEGNYPRNSIAEWSVISPYPDPEGNPRIRFALMNKTGETKRAIAQGSITMNMDKKIPFDWEKEYLVNFINLDIEGNSIPDTDLILTTVKIDSDSNLDPETEINITSEEWRPEGQAISWSVSPAREEIHGVRRLVPTPQSGSLSMIEPPIPVTVTWTGQWRLEVETNGTGEVSISDGGACTETTTGPFGEQRWCNDGGMVEFQAESFCDGVVFDHWVISDDDSPNGFLASSKKSLTLPMDQARRIEAKFVPKEFDSVVTLPLMRGWNLISLPVEPNSASADELFGEHAAGLVWTWEENQFKPVDTIAPLTGYWVYCPEPGNVRITGKLVCGVDFSVLGGWNLTGAVNDMSTSSLNPLAAWSWERERFAPVQFLERMKGYWIYGESSEGD